MVLSADPVRDPGPLALVGTAAALATSDLPFPEVLGAIRVSLVKGGLIALPTYDEQREAKLTITVCGTENGIVMVEAGAHDASEAEVLDAIDFGHQCCKKIIGGIRELVTQMGKPKMQYTPVPLDQELYGQIESQYRAKLADALDTAKYPKLESQTKVAALKAQIVEGTAEEKRPEVGLVRLAERTASFPWATS